MKRKFTNVITKNDIINYSKNLYELNFIKNSIEKINNNNIWVKLGYMKWILQNKLDIIEVNSLNLNMCNICKIERLSNWDAFHKCNSSICCFIRSLSQQIPKAFFNYKMNIIHNHVKRYISLKFISDIIINYIPLVDMHFNLYQTCICGHSINHWKPGYLCNNDPCLTNRMFDEMD